MTSCRNRIDVHHHLIPPAFTKAASSHGLTEVAGARLPQWSAEKSFATMDMHGIGTALLSLSAPGGYFGHLSEARKHALEAAMSSLPTWLSDIQSVLDRSPYSRCRSRNMPVRKPCMRWTS